IVDDITLETLVQKLRGAPRGLLLASDELAAWLTSFNQYKPRGRGADEARWLSMHRGAPLRWDRKSAPESYIYVKRASVSATGTIQPGTMKWAFTKQYRENGLLARFLLAMPTPRKREWTEYVLEQGLSDRVHSCFERLYQLEFAQSMPGKPIALPLQAAAKAAWIKFDNQHGEEKCGLSGQLASAWAKLEGYAARLALVLHCLRYAARAIPADADAAVAQARKMLAVDVAEINAGVALSRWFAREAERCYDMLAENEEEMEQRRLIDWIRAQARPVTIRDLQRGLRMYRSSAEGAEQALNQLVQDQQAKWVPAPGSVQGGRPRQACQLLGDPTPEENGLLCDTTS